VIELNKGAQTEDAKLVHAVLIPNSAALINNLHWKLKNRRSLTLGNVIIGKNTTFKQEFQV